MFIIFFYRLISFVFLPLFTLSLTLIFAIRDSFSGKEAVFWLALVCGIGYGVQAFYYMALRLQRKISIDVKDKEIRERLLKMSVVSLFTIFVIALFLTEARILQKTLLSAVIINLLFVVVLDIFKVELSFHIGMLTMLALYGAVYISYLSIPIGGVSLFFTGLSRYKLKMHTKAEIFLGFIVSGVVYGAILFM